MTYDGPCWCGSATTYVTAKFRTCNMDKSHDPDKIPDGEMPGKFLGLIHAGQVLRDAAASGKSKLVVNVPPRHGKPFINARTEWTTFDEAQAVKTSDTHSTEDVAELVTIMRKLSRRVEALEGHNIQGMSWQLDALAEIVDRILEERLQAAKATEESDWHEIDCDCGCETW